MLKFIVSALAGVVSIAATVEAKGAAGIDFDGDLNSLQRSHYM